MTYIPPITKIHSNSADAQEFFNKFGGHAWFDREEADDLDSILQGSRNMIVGEPGIGKTEMLKKMLEHLQKSGVEAALILLRKADAAEQIRKILGAERKPEALLLDGLDETPAKNRLEVIQELDRASNTHPDIAFHISGRWVFVHRYAKYFPTYRFVSISPFTRSQVHKYLVDSGKPEADVRQLLGKISFGHRTLIIQIPRYLSYLNAYVEERGIEAASSASRNELFEYFTWQKLKLEDDKLSTDKRALIRRVLEKLALTMEIYQTNVITKDELMTFFDDLSSDLKLVALSQFRIEEFYHYSLLRVSSEGLEKVEFENAEFQEYLAAKELSRFAEPARSAFTLAADADAQEIYPSWYNTLTFLVDMQPHLLESLVEFSGLRRRDYKIVDENFFRFLSRLDLATAPERIRSLLFKDVIEYHNRTLQWLEYQLADTLATFFDPSLDTYLQAQVAMAESAASETRVDNHRNIPLANIAYVVAGLLRSKKNIDKSYWRGKLISCALDKNENGVLQRHAFHALAELGDPSVLEELTDPPLHTELVVRAFVEMCVALDPDHRTTLKHVFELVRRGDIHGREGLYRLKDPASVQVFLRRFLEDDEFRHGFLQGASIFHEQDAAIAERIKEVSDEEIRELAKNALTVFFQRDVVYRAGHVYFFQALWQVLREGHSGFVTEMIKRIKPDPTARTHVFYASPLLDDVLRAEDVGSFIRAMSEVGEAPAAMHILANIRQSNRPGAVEIYEAGRPHLSDKYCEWEEAQSREDPFGVGRRKDELLKQFRTLLEPEPGKYDLDVLQYYNQHAEELDAVLTGADRARLLDLLQGTIFERVDPGRHRLTITHEEYDGVKYTVDIAIYVFGDAIKTAMRLGLDMSPYHRQLLNFIPFAYHPQLEMIFAAIPSIEADELAPILEVYRRRDSDLWRHRPESLIEAVKRYNVTSAAPVLKALVMESAIKQYAREQALIVLGSLSPDAAFLGEVFKRYKGDKSKARKLAEIANALLVTTHRDPDAIKWRMREVIKRAAPFVTPRGVHAVGELEDEINVSKGFAKPLMLLKEPGYEEEYLALIQEGVVLWGRGTPYHAYAEYLWGIAFAYFENLKDTRSYAPLTRLETSIAEAMDKEGTNWLASRMVGLRRTYLEHLGRPQNISSAVQRYNEAREYSEKRIRNAEELFHHLRDILSTDLRRWVEGEGAYRVLIEKGQGREELAQRTLKTQIENILGRRGFWVDVTREPQLLDNKRVDFLVRYGFAGPILIEVKLTSNSDLQRQRLDTAPSYESMRRYMEGFNAIRGIFLVIDNTNATNLTEIARAYRKIPNVHVEILRCDPVEPTSAA